MEPAKGHSFRLFHTVKEAYSGVVDEAPWLSGSQTSVTEEAGDFHTGHLYILLRCPEKQPL